MAAMRYRLRLLWLYRVNMICTCERLYFAVFAVLFSADARFAAQRYAASPCSRFLIDFRYSFSFRCRRRVQARLSTAFTFWAASHGAECQPRRWLKLLRG